MAVNKQDAVGFPVDSAGVMFNMVELVPDKK